MKNQPNKPVISESQSRKIAGAFSAWLEGETQKITAPMSNLIGSGLLIAQYAGKHQTKLTGAWVLTPIGPIERSEFTDEVSGSGEHSVIIAWHYRAEKIELTIFND